MMKKFTIIGCVVFVAAICFTMLFVSCAEPTNTTLPLEPEQAHGSNGKVYAPLYLQGDKYDDKGTYDDFINRLWIRESSIDPAKVDEYNKNFNEPYIDYQIVDSPGRVVRDNDGNPEHRMMTVKEYFTAIGVSDIFKLGSTDPKMFLAMQAKTTNFLGFVGFQFADGDLRDLGYYVHIEDGLPTYYMDLPNSTWANGVRSIHGVIDGILHNITDVNTWDGTWLGKNNIHSFAGFVDPAKHILVIKDHFALKHNNTIDELAKRDKNIQDYLQTKVYWSMLDPKVSPPPGGRSDEVVISMSGLLAGAHLRGAGGVVALLVDHKNPADEIGTHILEYVQDYGDYSTPWGP